MTLLKLVAAAALCGLITNVQAAKFPEPGQTLGFRIARYAE